MDIVLSIILVICFFALISFLLGTFVQLLSNWTGKTINVKSTAGWTTFYSKKHLERQKKELELFNIQMRAADSTLAMIHETLNRSNSANEKPKEYVFLPKMLKEKILAALETYSELEEDGIFSQNHNLSSWYVDYFELNYELIKNRYEMLSMINKDIISKFLRLFRLETRRNQQNIADRLMLKIDIKKSENKFSISMWPTNLDIVKTDIAFKDICLFLRDYPANNKAIDKKSSGHIKMSVYSMQIGNFTFNNDSDHSLLNYVAFDSVDISFEETKLMMKFAYDQMPQNFKSRYLYQVDFDRLQF